MFRRSLLLIVALAAPAAAQAQSSWALGMFTQTEHDWGRVERGAQLSHQFQFTNNTGKEVRIKRISVSCHCTTAMTSSYNIAPGETAFIDARMDTSGFQGSKSVVVTVRFERPRQTDVALRVSAVSGAAANTGVSEIDFGLVSVGTKIEKRLNLDFAGNSDWKVIGIDYNNANIAAEYVEVSRDAAKVRYELKLTVKDKAPVGTLDEKIRIRTNDARNPEVIVAAKAKIEGKLTVAPDVFKIDEVKPGEPVTKTLIVKSATPFRIVKAQNTAGMFSIRSGAEDRTAQMLVVTFTPPKDGAAVLPDHLELVTNLPDGKSLTLPVVKGAELK